MNEELIEKQEQLLEALKNNETVERFQQLQKRLLNNQTILESVKKLRECNPYDLNYKQIKKQLFANEEYKEYLRLSQEITYWTYEISQKLKELTRK